MLGIVVVLSAATLIALEGAGAASASTWTSYSLFPSFDYLIGSRFVSPHPDSPNQKTARWYTVSNVDDLTEDRPTLLNGAGCEFIHLDLTPSLDAKLTRMAEKGFVNGTRVGLKREQQNLQVVLFNLVAGSTANTTSLEDEIAQEFIGLNKGYSMEDAWHFNVEVSGFVLRKVWPRGVRFASNLDTGADTFHIDQDIEGEPFKSLVQAVPGVHWLFKTGALRLVNLWIPLNSKPNVVRNLAVMDRRSELLTDRVHYSWRAGIVAEGETQPKFLSELFLLNAPHPQMRFLAKPVMRRGDAILFSTTDVFHSAVPLPSDSTLDVLVRLLHAPGTCPSETERVKVQRTVHERSDELGVLAEEAHDLVARMWKVAQGLCDGTLGDSPATKALVRELLDEALRVSLEMRVVSICIRKSWVGAGAVAAMAGWWFCKRSF